MSENLEGVCIAAIVMIIFVFTSAAILKGLSWVFDRCKKIRRLHKMKSLTPKTYSDVCPFCHTELEVPPKANGQKVQCPECGNNFITRKHSLNKFELDFEKAKWWFSTARECQILLASIILAIAIVVHALLTHNNNRYHFHRRDNGQTSVFDSKTGELYIRRGECIINMINGK